ncbi:MAG: amino acid ABC transporter permease [Rhodospirillales bacterium]|nr:amino acid ABC transporter permease [Rhodospirillales bacterium]
MDFFRIDLALKYAPLLLEGTLITVLLTIGVQIVSLLLGLFATLVRLTRIRLLVLPISVYVDFFRGTPLLIQLYWVFFALPIILNRDVSSIVSAITALCLHMGAYQAETIRAGIQAIHKGQMMASRGLGMSYAMAMRRVILPQATRKMTPELISNFVQVLKGTAIVSVLGFPELMYYANLVNSFSFRSVEVYTSVAIIYFALAFPISMWARRYEKTLLRTEA